jgi:DNA-binding transcriptional ArsR family regulator
MIGAHMPYALEQEINQLHAEICAGLADPKRILILYALHEKPRNVNELVELLELSQPMVSRHLKVLRERGMVNTVRYGTTVEYRLSDERLIQALDLLRAVLASKLISQAALADTITDTASAIETKEG